MEINLRELSDLVIRWTHLVAGILWIGHLYFFNFVNAQLAKTYDADSKKKVVPELMPRALYWFRWGAAFTWLSGFLLLGLAIYMGGAMVGTTLGPTGGAVAGIGLMIVGFGIYDVLWKALAKNEPAGTAISFVLIVGAAAAMQHLMGGRAAWIHVGAIFGTAMAANVWMRIWPAQRKIIAAIKAGNAPDAALAAMAGLRSKHNTYMSVPLMLMMLSGHFSSVYLHPFGWAFAGAFIALGFAATKFMYTKSASSTPSGF